MALNGATKKAIKDYQISDYSDSELNTLSILVGRFGKKEIDIKGVFMELRGNKEMCAKFQRLGQLAADSPSLRANIVRLMALEQKITTLQHSVQEHESAISASRTQAASSVAATVEESPISAKVRF